MSLHDRVKAASLTEQATGKPKSLTERVSVGLTSQGIYGARDAQYALEDVATALARLQDGGFRYRRNKPDEASKALLKEALDSIHSAAKTVKKLADAEDD